MKNKALIKAICLVLALSLSLISFAGCNPKEEEKPTSSETIQSSDETDETEDFDEDENLEDEDLEDEYLEDEDWDDDWDEEDWDDDWDEEDLDEEYWDEEYDESEEDYEDEENYDEYLDLSATVKNATPISTRYSGAGMGLYNGTVYMYDTALDRQATELQAEIELDRLEYMGIHTVRSMFKFLWAENSTNAGTGEWDWESEKMQAFYRFLQEAKDRNIDVMVNPWSWQHIAMESSSIPDSEYFKYNGDFDISSKRWCESVTKLFTELRARGYTNAKYLVVFTEPIRGFEEHVTPWDHDWYVQNLKTLHSMLTEAGLRNNIKTMGPNLGHEEVTLLEKIIKEAPETLDIYSHHGYIRGASLVEDTFADAAQEEYSIYVNTAKKDGSKPLWIDEWNVQDGQLSSLKISNLGYDQPWRGIQQVSVYAESLNIGVDALALWTLVDQVWPDQSNTDVSAGFDQGVLIHGLFSSILDKVTPKTQYYAYSLLTKYTGRHGGKTYYAGTDETYMGIHMSMVETAEGELTLILVNTNIEDCKMTIGFEEKLEGRKFYKHSYIASEIVPNINSQIIPASRTIKNVTDKFVDYVAAGSVTVYTTIKG